ncbi:MAG: hypothetical protein LBJ67_13645 [Planctomycetaceae bacterium]|jgi:hypothetical protein|nr:hypothetical protein [Planctomycetaceae bacterium]
MTFLDTIPQLFFAIPLVIAFSFVYQGTRSEKMPIIFRHSLRTMVSLTILMAVILAFLEWVSP